ncbi:hypothetical protein [Pseudoalteromonas xiamenensis]
MHDPVQIAQITFELFGIRLPILYEEFTLKLLCIRNAFTHNNGMMGGEYIKLNYQDVKNVHKIFIALVNGYVNKVIEETDAALAAMDET